MKHASDVFRTSPRSLLWPAIGWDVVNIPAATILSASINCCGPKDAFHITRCDCMCSTIFCLTIGIPTCAVQIPLGIATTTAGLFADLACSLTSLICAPKSDSANNVITEMEEALKNKEVRQLVDIFTATTTTRKMRDELVYTFNDRLVKALIEFEGTNVSTREKIQVLLYLHERGRYVSLVVDQSFITRLHTDSPDKNLPIYFLLVNKSADSHIILDIVLHLSNAKYYLNTTNLNYMAKIIGNAYIEGIFTFEQARKKAEILKKYKLVSKVKPPKGENLEFYKLFKNILKVAKRNEITKKTFQSFSFFVAEPVVNIINSYGEPVNDLIIKARPKV